MPIAQPPSETKRTSLKSIVEATFRHKKVFAAAFCMTLLLALLYIFGTHKKYSSSMTLLVQNARSNGLISAEKTDGVPLITDVSEEQLNSQAEVLQSKDVLDEVITPGWNKESPEERTQAQLSQHDSSVDYLRKHLKVIPVKKSHVIDVELKMQDPKAATNLLDRLLTVFLAKQREISRPAGTSQFFADAAERYRKDWEKAQAKLAAFQQQQQMVSPRDKETMLEQEVADADTQLRNADVLVNELQHRVAADSVAVKSLPARQDTLQRKTPDTGYMDQLSALLVQLQNQRTELMTKYLPTDRLIKQVDEQIAQTQDALSKAQAVNYSDSSTNVNPTWEAADQSLSEKQAELKAVQARRSGLAAHLATLQGQLAATAGSQLDFQSLQHQVTDAETNYQTYTQKRDEAQISDAMDAHDLLNVAVVQYPTYSPVPVHPRPLIDTALGIFSALFVGVFAVFIAESGRQTFAAPYELEAVSHHPVLATIPWSRALPGGGGLQRLENGGRISTLTQVGASVSRWRKSGAFLHLW